MRVSIVTPCYNSGDTLARTIESVLSQTYPDIEYIIMDGASTDNTQTVVQPYLSDPRLTFITEPDEGQSDAINKGWQRATGDVIAWLCADDIYLPHTVQTAVDTLTENPSVGWVYGRDCYVNRDEDPVPFNHNPNTWDYEQYLTQALYISQPTTFWRREIIEEFGLLRKDLHYMMDMEFYLRIGRKFPGYFIDDTLAVIMWTRDTKTFAGSVERLQEMEQVIRDYGGGELAETVRVQWADTHLEQAIKQLSQGKFAAALDAFRSAWRFPSHVPRGMAKMLIRALLTEQMETQLRRKLLRS